MSIMDLQVFKMMFALNRATPLELDRGLVSARDMEVLIALCSFIKPKVMVEIGIFEGKTSSVILGKSPWIEKYIGVDVKQDQLPKEYFEEYREIKDAMGKQVKLVDPGFLARGDARFNLVLLDDVNGLRSEMLCPADMIFIDGNHSYEGVKRDTAIARSSLRNGKGILLWHDYLYCPGVSKLIDGYNAIEDRICLIKGTNICFEIIG